MKSGKCFKGILCWVVFLTSVFWGFKAWGDRLSDIASSGTPEEVRQAFSSGEFINKLYPGGETPIMFAAANNKNLNVIRTLVEIGAEVNVSDDVGLTPLMFSITTNKSPGVTYELLTLGANPLAKDKEGVSVIMYAARDADPAVFETLLAKNADINSVTANGWSPLMYAAFQNPNLRVTEMLLEAGAEVNTKNSSGMTPLIIAAQYTKNPQILELLLRYSADTTHAVNGTRAIDYALKNKNLNGSAALRNLDRTTKLRLSEK